jgi:hypothetical protein
VGEGGALMPLWTKQWLSQPRSKQQFNWKSNREENQEIWENKKANGNNSPLPAC